MSKAPTGEAKQSYFEEAPGNPWWVAQAVKVALDEFAHKAERGENFFLGQKRKRDEWTKIPDLRGSQLIVNIREDGSVLVRQVRNDEVTEMD